MDGRINNDTSLHLVQISSPTNKKWKTNGNPKREVMKIEVYRLQDVYLSQKFNN